MIPSVSSDTIIDELDEEGMFTYTTIKNFDRDNHLLPDETISMTVAADQLVDFIKIKKAIRKANIVFENIDSLKPLTEEELEKISTIKLDDVEELIELSKYRGKDLQALEQRIVSVKMLNDIYNRVSRWVRTNGRPIGIDTLMYSIKGAIGEDFNLDASDYSMIEIGDRPGTKRDVFSSFEVKVGDNTYKTKATQKLRSTISYLYEMQEFDPGLVDEEREENTYLEAINRAKEMMARGVNRTGNKLIDQNSESYVSKTVKRSK